MLERRGGEKKKYVTSFKANNWHNKSQKTVPRQGGRGVALTRLGGGRGWETNFTH